MDKYFWAKSKRDGKYTIVFRDCDGDFFVFGNEEYLTLKEIERYYVLGKEIKLEEN